MSFANPSVLWLLLVIPPALLVFYWWSARVRRKLMTQFVQSRLLPGLIAGVSVTRQRVRAGLLVLAVLFLIVTLAQPQWGYDLDEVRQRGLDIVVAIDTSRSMLAEDIPPNRLARAKLAALDLMQAAKTDRLGLVAFAGSAFLQCPLTVDDSAFRQTLEALNVQTIPEGGTAIGEAIATASKAFKEGDNYKVLVLFTDGEDHDSDALAAAQRAAKSGLRIFTIGIGSAEGELLRVKGENGQMDYVRDENGHVVKSHLNEALLQQIAGAANGFYLPLRGAKTIDTLYQSGLAPLPKTESKERWVRRPRERYHWPLALALALLAAEMLFPERKRMTARRGQNRSQPDPALPGKRSRAENEPAGRIAGRVEAAAATSPGFSRMAMLGFAVLFAASPAPASPASALREYNAGHYTEALKEYEQSLGKKDPDPRLHFNAGAAAYRDRKFDQAVKHFGQALASPDLKVQEHSYYNLGNTLYYLGDQNPDPQKKTQSWETAMKHFDSAFKLNTNDADARFNYEFVKRQLEELKRQQQQQQLQQQQQQQQNQQQNQQQDQQQNQQPQDQQDQQSPNNQQQDSQSQPQREPQQQDSSQPQDQDRKDQDQQQAGKPEEKPNPEPQPQPTSGEEQNQPEPGEQQQQQQASAPGQMTPKEAQQLLDAQKNDELMMPVSRKQETSNHQAPVKDW